MFTIDFISLFLSSTSLHFKRQNTKLKNLYSVIHRFDIHISGLLPLHFTLLSSQSYQEIARAKIHFIVANTALPVSRTDPNKAASTPIVATPYPLQDSRSFPLFFTAAAWSALAEPYAGNRRYNVFMGHAPWRESE